MPRMTSVARGLSLLVFGACLAVWASYWSDHPIAASCPCAATTAHPYFGFNPVRGGISIGCFDPCRVLRPSWPKNDQQAFLATFAHLPHPLSVHVAGFWALWRSPVFLDVPRPNARTEYVGCGYSVIIPAWFFLAATAILPANSLVHWLRVRRSAQPGFPIDAGRAVQQAATSFRH